MLTTASIKIYSAPTATPKVTPWKATGTHFSTAGRLLSFFPQVNENGFTFRKEDCPDDVVQTLVGSTVDLEHLKPGYGSVSTVVRGVSNATFGAIVEAVKHDEGIDIVAKLERSVAGTFGFTPEDFAPGEGHLAQYSQECNFAPTNGKYIVVSKSNPSEILEEISYPDGLARGFRDVASGVGPSHMGADGKWSYQTVDGNPVYFAAVPSSFSGVGHVAKPADVSAITYQMAASLQTAKLNKADWMPGMDEGGNPGTDLTGLYGDLADGDPTSADYNCWTGDLATHPDIMTADADQFTADKDADDKKVPDHHFAVNYSCMDFGSVTNGTPNKVQKRLFRIKDDKGNLHRGRLIAAYRQLAGTRGDIQTVKDLPRGVRRHALAVVRQGLKLTKPKENSSSMNPEINPEIEALNQKIRELQEAKSVSSSDHAAVVSERDAAKALIEEMKATVETLKSSLAEKESALATVEAEKLSTARLAELHEILPYTDEEKKAETFEATVKSLASLSAESFAIAKLQRENTKLAAALASQSKPQSRIVSSATPAVNPVPAFSGDSGEAVTLEVLY